MTEVSLKRMSSNSKAGEERAFQVGEWGLGQGHQKQRQRDEHQNSAYVVPLLK